MAVCFKAHCHKFWSLLQMLAGPWSEDIFPHFFQVEQTKGQHKLRPLAKAFRLDFALTAQLYLIYAEVCSTFCEQYWTSSTSQWARNEPQAAGLLWTCSALYVHSPSGVSCKSLFTLYTPTSCMISIDIMVLFYELNTACCPFSDGLSSIAPDV